MVSQASKKKHWQLPDFGRLGYLYFHKQTIIPFWLKMFWTGQTHQYIYHNTLVKIDAINVTNECAARSVKTVIRFLCCSGVLAALSKFRTSVRTRQKKYILACVIQEIRNWDLFTVPSLVTQKKYNADNCILLMIINFSIFSTIIGGPASCIANPKLWGPKVWL